MAQLLYGIRQHYPNVKVYFILNDELKKEINESVEKVCKHYNVTLIKLHGIKKKTGHPTVQGMKDFAQQVLDTIKSDK